MFFCKPSFRFLNHRRFLTVSFLFSRGRWNLVCSLCVCMYVGCEEKFLSFEKVTISVLKEHHPVIILSYIWSGSEKLFYLVFFFIFKMFQLCFNLFSINCITAQFMFFYVPKIKKKRGVRNQVFGYLSIRTASYERNETRNKMFTCMLGWSRKLGFKMVLNSTIHVLLSVSVCTLI